MRRCPCLGASTCSCWPCGHCSDQFVCNNRVVVGCSNRGHALILQVGPGTRDGKPWALCERRAPLPAGLMCFSCLLNPSVSEFDQSKKRLISWDSMNLLAASHGARHPLRQERNSGHEAQRSLQKFPCQVSDCSVNSCSQPWHAMHVDTRATSVDHLAVLSQNHAG
jgi:hypothetical protein